MEHPNRPSRGRAGKLRRILLQSKRREQHVSFTTLDKQSPQASTLLMRVTQNLEMGIDTQFCKLLYHVGYVFDSWQESFPAQKD